MPKSKVSQTGMLTQRQMNFVSCWAGSSVAAARAAGYRDPKGAACKLMKVPQIKDLIREKQQSMARESGKALVGQIAPSRIDIINHLWQLARLAPERTNNNITGQMKATDTLAEIFALKFDSQSDFDREVEGKTQADIDFFVAHGYFPAHSTQPKNEDSNEDNEDKEDKDEPHASST
ncbi:MAG TPA: hypothetical protein VNW97_09780 [Candidatus Saccharimonadales bacterium]|jgi:hypothetical protein|nr:hypothetical protein [Candidatus Saccharimonadales bacterium]